MEAATIFAVLFGAIGGVGGVAALIRVFLVDRKQTGTEAAKASAEIKSLGIDDQSDIIGNLRTEVARLSERLDLQAVRIDKLEASNNDLENTNAGLRSALTMLSRWAERVRTILTHDQHLMVGDPPEVDKLLMAGERG